MYQKIPDDFSILCDLRATVPAQLTSETLRLIKNSILTKKYVIERDINNIPIGYIAWASINMETLLRLNRTGWFPQYFYEWKEGDITLILDMLLLPNQLDISTRTLILDFVKVREKVAFVKRNQLFFLTKSNDRLQRTPII